MELLNKIIELPQRLKEEFKTAYYTLLLVNVIVLIFTIINILKKK